MASFAAWDSDEMTYDLAFAQVAVQSELGWATPDGDRLHEIRDVGLVEPTPRPRRGGRPER
jgi:DNA transposition AAA+ family ATPase